MSTAPANLEEAEERLILLALDDLRKRYAEEARPLRDRLVALRTERVPSIAVRAQMTPHQLLMKVRHG